MLECGAFNIAIAEDTGTLAAYETQHHDLRERYRSSTVVGKIRQLGQNLKVLLSEIRRVLVEFGKKVELPRYYKLCLTTIWSSEDSLTDPDEE